MNELKWVALSLTLCYVKSSFCGTPELNRILSPTRTTHGSWLDRKSSSRVFLFRTVSMSAKAPQGLDGWHVGY